MELQYKDQIDDESPREFKEQSTPEVVVQLSYEEQLDNLFSDEDPEIILDSIKNIGELARINFSKFKDCVVFTKIAEIADDPLFDNYLVALRFFDNITWNCSNEEDLAIFISPSFLSLLKNLLYINNEYPNFYGYLFHIYGNIISKSKFFSTQIFSIDFLRRLFDIVKNLPILSGDFLSLLGDILIRFTILDQFDPDPIPIIRQILIEFVESPEFQTFSDAFSTISRISSLPFPFFVKSFFSPSIVNKAIENITVNVDEIIDDKEMVQIGPYTAHKSFIHSLKKDSLVIILNFTAIDNEILSTLIENTSLLDIDIYKICESQTDPNQLNEYSKFFADIASNFFRSSHTIAIQFVYSMFWQSLLHSYHYFNALTKSRIAFSISVALSTHQSDEDLITTMLAEDQASIIVEIFIDCFELDCVDFQLTCIDAILNMINIYKEHPTLVEINNVFSIMNEMGLIDLIDEYSQESDLITKIYDKIQLILGFLRPDEEETLIEE